MASKVRREIQEHQRYRAFADEIVTRAMKVFARLPEGEPKKEMREALRHYLYNNNYSCMITPERPMAPEYKMLIRDDCNGDIYAVDKNFLSFHYRYALKNAGLEKYAAADYAKALKKCKAWEEMREFPTYRSVEEVMLERLYEQQLPPTLIKAMQINDFRDFVRTSCGEEFAGYRERKSFIKTFINAREDEFREMLKYAGVNPYYADALVDRMHKKGEAWDIVVCDREGNRIEGPEFDRHHIEPVYSPNNLSSLSEANSFGKLCLFEKRYHRFLHKLERAKISGDLLYFEKMMVPENAACVLDFEHVVRHDFAAPERPLKQLRPGADNYHFLNRLEQLTNKYISLVPADKREKTPDKFVHRGGKGSR